MSTITKFIEWLNEQVKNHSIYVWGAQGEDSSIISEKWIRKMVTPVAWMPLPEPYEGDV